MKVDFKRVVFIMGSRKEALKKGTRGEPRWMNRLGVPSYNSSNC